jgi:nitrate/TMAO reductase-like tetraheme cytochrome c subunit
MRRILDGIRRFFFPPAGSPRWIKVLPYAVLGVFTILVLTAGVYTWDYTNSPQFCGTTCHTMPPEFTAYLTSPHARIDCVDCHIGKSFIATKITRKAGDITHVTNTIFRNYEFPIRAHDLRPARETCEKCHYPEKFSDDSLRQMKRFASDTDNTATTIYLDLKTGGGSQRVGLGKGIHWHIENQVFYLPIDPEEQQIPYIKVIEDDGSTTEYVDIDAQIDTQSINPEDLKEMDCITCHNRITHLVLTPEETVDQLMDRGEISTDIPEIHQKAIEVYSQIYDTTEKGVNGIAGLSGYYQAYYPDYYADNRDKIDAAISALQTAYRNSVFPEQNSDWTTHPNNIGHKDSPGCFRCHDGKHLDAEQHAIRLECNLCHAIPVVAGPTDFVADLEISRGPEPSSHLNPNWISLHHSVFDNTCSDCHTTSNPGGTDNSSFCSNSACHGNVWKFAGFDAPGLREVLLDQLPPTPTPMPTPAEGPLTYDGSIGPLLQARCGACHSPSGGIQGLDLTTYQGIMTGSVNGKVVVPGNPDESMIVQKQSGDQPHFGQLNPQELELVVKWIEAGAPEK